MFVRGEMVSSTAISAVTAHASTSTATSKSALSSRTSGFSGEASPSPELVMQHTLCPHICIQTSTFPIRTPNRRLAACLMAYRKWREASARRPRILSPRS